MNGLSIAILGGGNMGGALIGGLIGRGASPASIAVGEARDAQRNALARDFGVRVYADNAAAVEGAQVVILAVKPQDAAAALTSIAAQLPAPRPLLLSVAAGVRVSALQRACGRAIPIVRAMPN
ncbi:MAG: pyrroline-5-carboxylate reductase family protein, partial [Steroidobacteraceae bacterium]